MGGGDREESISLMEYVAKGFLLQTHAIACTVRNAFALSHFKCMLRMIFCFPSRSMSALYAYEILGVEATRLQSLAFQSRSCKFFSEPLFTSTLLQHALMSKLAGMPVVLLQSIYIYIYIYSFCFSLSLSLHN